MLAPAGKWINGALRVDFDRRLQLEIPPQLHHLQRWTTRVSRTRRCSWPDRSGRWRFSDSRRRKKNIRHRLLGLLRQAVYGRLAGYEDVNDAERLAHDGDARHRGREGWIAGGLDSEMGRFETEWLATEANLAALTDLSGSLDRPGA